MIALVKTDGQRQHQRADRNGNHDARQHQAAGDGIDVSIHILDTVHHDWGNTPGNVALFRQEQVNGIQDVNTYINPIPSGLVLTGIVVSVSVSALMLSLTIRLYNRYHTLDLDEISARLRKEGL